MRRYLAVFLASGAVALLLGAPASALAQNTPAQARWARTFGSDRADHAAGVAVRADGSLVVAGYTDGTLPGATSSGASDLFVASFDADGQPRWTRQFGGRGADRATGVAVDAQGDAYVSGFTSNSLPPADSVGAGDAFVAKVGSDGTLLWLRQFGTTGADYARSVAVDATGNVFVGGDTNGTLPGNTNLGGDGDAFLAKFDASGDLVWLRQFGSAAADKVTSVTTDARGDVLAVGTTRGTLPTNRARGGSDAFMIKLDGNGTRVWLRQFGSEGADYAYGVAADAAGGAFATGFTYGSLPGNVSSGNIDGFLAHVDANGNRTLLRQFGDDGAVFGYAVALDAAGNPFVGGWADLDPLGGSPAPGPWRAYVATFDAQGAPRGIHQFGTSGMEQPVGVALGPDGAIYVTTSGVLPPGGTPEDTDTSPRPPVGANDVLLLSYPP
jgi:hypothetical protein